jgi:hypothetical protein
MPARSNGRWPAAERGNPKAAEVSNPASAAQHHPSPDPTTTRPGRHHVPGQPHARGAGSDARYEHLRHAALNARAEAFPLGLAVLTRQGLTAWTHALAELAPTSTAPTPAATEAPLLPCAALTRELVNILAALTLVST